MVAPAYPSFVPRAPWLGADLQTVRNALRGPALRDPMGAPRRRLELPLGDGDRLVAHLLPPPEVVRRPDAPLVILVHGLGGCEESPYMVTTAAHLHREGWPVLKLNLRGAGPSRPLCRSQYHAGRSEDFHAALAALSPSLLRDGAVAVGFSLGGNMLLKYAAEYGGLRGVVSVSAPIDLAAASRRFLEPRNRAYHRHLLAGLKREALAGAGLADEERQRLPRLRTLLDFDEAFVAPRNGFTGAADYYARSAARGFLDAIALPALLLHAADDPWIPSEAYRAFDWSRNPRLTLLLAPGGGHVGFHGRGTPVPWHDRCLLEFLASL